MFFKISVAKIAFILSLAARIYAQTISSVEVEFNDEESKEISVGDQLIYIHSFREYIEKIVFATVGSIFQYIICCGLMEYFNPIPKNKKRINNILKEFKYGCIMLFCGGWATMKTWYFLLEPHTRHHRYYESNDLKFQNILFGVIVQYCFITFFAYWIHRWLHTNYMYKNVHSIHHSFKECSAFAFCAAHPVEGWLEGSLLLHLTEVIYPIHPIQTLAFGMFMQFQDMFAHDGGLLDFSHHYKHHLYYVVNYGPLFLDKIFGTAYNTNNYPVKETCSYLEAKENNGTKIVPKQLTGVLRHYYQ